MILIRGPKNNGRAIMNTYNIWEEIPIDDLIDLEMQEIHERNYQEMLEQQAEELYVHDIRAH